MRMPSPAKWAYMQEIGKSRYVITRTLLLEGILCASMILGGFFAGATVHTVSWLGIGMAMLVSAPLVCLQVMRHWDQCEASEGLRLPRLDTPRS